jgi:hypothetical protein
MKQTPLNFLKISKGIVEIAAHMYHWQHSIYMGVSEQVFGEWAIFLVVQPRGGGTSLAICD